LADFARLFVSNLALVPNERQIVGSNRSATITAPKTFTRKIILEVNAEFTVSTIQANIGCLEGVDSSIASPEFLFTRKALKARIAVATLLTYSIEALLLSLSTTNVQ